jgi:polyisoprenoid-binding protein YceI
MKRILLIILALSWVMAQNTAGVKPVALNSESIVQYDAKDQNNAWSAQAPVSSLTMTLDANNVSASSLSISVKAADFNSGNIFRDTNARRTVFDTSQYPDITFVAKRISSETNTFVEGDNDVTLSGDLTLHGVTKELSTVAVVNLTGQSVNASGSFTVNMLDFGMTPPVLFGIAVSETVTIKFNVVGSF